MVCDSRYELTSKHPGRGRGRDGERGGEKGNASRGEEKVLEIREGREVRLQTIAARIKREDEECVKVRASSQVGVTERSVLVSSPAACVPLSAEYQVFCTEQVQILCFSLSS